MKIYVTRTFFGFSSNSKFHLTQITAEIKPTKTPMKYGPKGPPFFYKKVLQGSKQVSHRYNLAYK